MRFISPRARRASLVLVAIAVSGGFAPSASATGASAYALSAAFVADGIATGIEPVNGLEGSSKQHFDKTQKTGPYQQIVHIAGKKLPVPTLVASAGNFKSHVSGISGIAGFTTSGESTASGLDISFALYPIPTEGTIPAPFLRLTATKVAQSGNFSMIGKAAVANASTSFNKLVVAGTLVNNKTLKFSGEAANNTVLFQSPTVTITLGSRVETSLISCSPKCVVTPDSERTSALHIALTDAVVDGHKVTGQIDIGAVAIGSGL